MTLPAWSDIPRSIGWDRSEAASPFIEHTDQPASPGPALELRGELLEGVDHEEQRLHVPDVVVLFGDPIGIERHPRDRVAQAVLVSPCEERIPFP